ncbi:hypothetical protein KQX54_014123 [Cotesia glomerata]|uniref:Uncharacterized protein n=1 Tax=Cotesia glomerata TaxID=32391 RepID=A0AAV7HWL0_COTGL|nr:hypothetical protein KQX54_014123 [Cotesia glomerata]
MNKLFIWCSNGVSNVSSAGSGTSSVSPANGVSNVSSAGPGTSSVSPANGVSSASPAVAGTSNVSPVQPLTAAIIISDSDNDEDPVNHKFICVCCRKNLPVLAFVHCGHRCVCRLPPKSGEQVPIMSPMFWRHSNL